MTRESSLWTTFKAALPLDCHAVRVENSVELGTPDVNLCWPENESVVRNGWDGWIELKVQEPPKRVKTLFRCGHFTMEQRQCLVDRCRAGGKAYMLMQVDAPNPKNNRPENTGPKYLWLRGDIAAVWIGECTLGELIGKAEWSGNRLSELVEHLT